jgi:hypothetical protein
MIKRLLVYAAVLLAVFVMSYNAHSVILESGELVLSFSLINTYVFHLIASFAIYVLIEVVAFYASTQAGYAFLASVFVKIGLFTLIFMPSLFSDNDLQMFERVSVIVPLFVFLTLEAIACSRLLNKA